MSIEKEIKQKVFKNPYNKVTVNVMFTTGWLLTKNSKILKPYNLTEQQYNVLKILRECYPQSANVNFILERMIDKMSNASRLVDKLVLKGLVKKVKSLYDLRSVDILLTEEGIKLADELIVKVTEYENSFYGLNDKEIKLLNVLLEKLRNKGE